MPDDRVRIVIGADSSQVDAVSKKTKKGMKDVADEAAKVGGELDKWGRKLATSLVGIGAVVAGIRAVSQAVLDVQKATADANRKQGGSALDRGITAGRLGISTGTADALTGGYSARSGAEMDSLLSSMAGLKTKSGGKLTGQQIARASNLYRGGAFDAEEITKALSEGTFSQLEQTSGARMDALGGAAQTELAIRTEENANSRAAQQSQAARGQGARLGQSRRTARNAMNPMTGALQDIVGAATSKVGGDAIIEASDVALNSNTAALSANTRAMSRPALAPPPQ